jgi:hypothetical protein
MLVTAMVEHPRLYMLPALELELYAYCAHDRRVDGPPPGVLSKLNGASTARTTTTYSETSNSQNMWSTHMVTESDSRGSSGFVYVHSRDKLGVGNDVLDVLI